MKTVIKIKDKKQKVLKKPKLKSKKEKVLIVAQEIKFARLLSGNEKKTRDRVLKTFKKWLLNCFERGYEFKEDDFIRVWKGLFYAVWMSDKPLVQEELCETIAGILDLFPPAQIQHALLMTRAGLRVLATEWYGIDQHRMDKFLMLVRRYLRGSLRCLLRCEWSLHSCQMYTKMLTEGDGILSLKTPPYARNATSMLTHFVECFLEELSKVSSGLIPPDSVTELMRPFCLYTCGGEVPALVTACRRLLTALVRQSDVGLEYQDRTRAWKSMGCPRGGPDALELASDDDGEGASDEERHVDDDGEDDSAARPLDPRAGRVDVHLSPVPVPAHQLAALLRCLLANAASKAYRRTKICLERFEQLAKNQYPLPVEDVFTEDTPPPTPRAQAVKSLQALEKKLVASSDELALRGLSRKHRKRLLARARAGLSIVEEVAAARGASRAATNGNWEVESTVITTEKVNETKIDTSNKENVHKDRNAKKRKLNTSQTDKHKKQKLTHENGESNKKPNVKDKKSFGKDTKVSKKLKMKNKPKQMNGVQEKITVTAEKSNKAIKLNRISEKSVANKETNHKAKDVNKFPEKSMINKDGNDKVTKSNEKQKSKEKNLLKSNDSNKNNEKPVKLNTKNEATKKIDTTNKIESKTINKDNKKPTVLASKVKNYQKKTYTDKKDGPQKINSHETPKKVKFVLKNNSMQGPVDYYKSVRQSPNIPFDSSKKPTKTNLKVSTPSPINPFFKKKLRLK